MSKEYNRKNFAVKLKIGTIKSKLTEETTESSYA